MPASLSTIARRFLFVRETEGPNKGYWVNFIQRFTGNAEGDSWCASFVSLVDDIATKGSMRAVKTASANDMLTAAKAKKQIVPTPAVDDLVFTTHPFGYAHHVGIVTNTNPLMAIAGNTSEDGKSDNGTGVFEHPISTVNKVYVRLT